MSESEDGRRPPSNRRRRSLIIRRDDHIGDSVGSAFLRAPESQGDEILERIGEYLGAQIKILKAVFSAEQIEVDVEARGWPQEGARLAAAARDLHGKGARRNAIALYREAIEIDPLNAQALAGLGQALAEQNHHEAALDALTRAREFGGDSAELLAAMAWAASRIDRQSAALEYAQAALKLDPGSFPARRLLRQLGASAEPPKSAPDAPRPRRE